MEHPKGSKVIRQLLSSFEMNTESVKHSNQQHLCHIQAQSSVLVPLQFISALHCSSERCTIPQSEAGPETCVTQAEESTKANKVLCCGDCINRVGVRSLTAAD